MKILYPQLKQADFVRTVYAATPEQGTTLDDLKTPEFWAHVAKQFKPGDRIEAIPDGGDWLAELHVLKVDVMGVHVSVLRVCELKNDSSAKPAPKAQTSAAKPAPAKAKDEDDESENKDSEYTVQFGGGDKWRVLRKSDKAVMIKHLNSRKEGLAWVEENTKALA